MKEVWKLREELRNKERSIAQLTLQQQQLQQQGVSLQEGSSRGLQSFSASARQLLSATLGYVGVVVLLIP